MTAASPPLPLLSHSHHLNASAPPYTPQQQQQQQQKQAPAKAAAALPFSSSAPPPSSSSAAPAASSQSQPLLPVVSLQSLLSSSVSAADRVEVCSRYFSSPACRSRELLGHRRPVRCLRWNATGSRLGSAGVDSVIQVWTLQPLLSATAAAAAGSGGFIPSSAVSVLELRGHSESVEQLVWCDAPLAPSAAQHQHLLASASLDQTVRIFDTNSRHISSELQRSGRLLATLVCAELRVACCCAAAGGRCIFSLNCGGDNISIAWSRDGRRIAVGNKRNSVSIIDVPSLPSCSGCRVLAVCSYSYEINDIAFAHSGSRALLALTTGKGSVEILDVDAAISSRTTAAAVAASSSSSSVPVQLNNPPPVCSLDNHSAAVYCLSLSGDGRLLGSGGADAVVCVRETASLTPLCLLSRLDSPIRCLSFSHPSLSLIAIGGEDGQLEISAVDAATGSRVWLTQLSAELNSLAFHPSLPLLAYATDSKDKCSVTLFGVA